MNLRYTIALLVGIFLSNITFAQTVTCHGPNLWFNGDFEQTSDLVLSGWNPNCVPPFYQVITSTTPGFLYPDIDDHTPTSADQFMWSDHSLTPCVFFPIGSNVNILTQTLPTIPGQTYHFGTWLYQFCLNLGGKFGFAVDATIVQVYDLSNPPNCVPGWQYYSVDWVATDSLTDFGIVDIDWHLFGWDMAFDDVEVYAVSPFAIATSPTDTSICAGACTPLSVHATDGHIKSLEWTPATGLSSTMDSLLTACPSVTTDYQVIAQDSTGCRDTAMVKVTVNPIPVMELGDDQVVCEGECASLGTNTPPPNAAYNWSTGATTPAVTICPNVVAQDVRVTVTDNGCTYIDSVVINRSLPPTIIAQMPDCSLDLLSWSVTLLATGSTTFSPSVGDLQNLGNGSYLVENISINNSLNIMAFNSNNCQGSLDIDPPQCNCPTVPPPANSGDQSVCENLPIPSLSVSVPSGVQVSWHTAAVGGDLLASNTTTYAPTTSGIYYAESLDLLNGCRSVVRTPVALTIHPALSVALGPDKTLCEEESVTLSVSGVMLPANFAWSNGATTSTNPVTPDVTTTYTVQVTNANGCIGTDTIVVNIEAIPGIQPIVNECNDSLTAWQTQFISLNIGDIQFTFGNLVPTGPNTYLLENIPEGTSVKITVFSLTGACKRAIIIDPVVCDCPLDIPVPIVPGTYAVCPDAALPPFNALTQPGYAIDWFATPTGGTPLLQNNPTFQATSLGTYYAESRDLMTGCTSVERVAVTLAYHDLPVVSLPDTAVIGCGEESLPLPAAGSPSGPGFQINWATPSGQPPIFPNGDELEIEVNEPGYYHLTINDLQTTCSNADSVLVLKTDNPSLTFDIEQPLCKGDKGTLHITSAMGGFPPYLYSIDGGATFGTDTLYEDLRPGPYQVILKDAADCLIENPMQVDSPAQIDLRLRRILTLELGESYFLQPTTSLPLEAIDTAYWTPSEYLTCATCLQTIVTPLNNTDYTLTAVDTNGCIDQATISITVDNNIGLFFPNALRQDNLEPDNNYFTVYCRPGALSEVAEMRVWNRWGELMFEQEHFPPNTPSVGWDGTFRRRIAPQGVYGFWVRLILSDGTEITRSGDFLIVK